MLGIELNSFLVTQSMTYIDMADGAPPTPQPPPVPPVQLPAPPAQPALPHTQPIQPGPMPQLNRSHFKTEFTGKPHKDAHADWMDTQAFLIGVKVQRFCLTLVGEASLWYESLTPIALDWNELQNQFRQQYSMIGNTREQLFQPLRSFHFSET